LYVFAAHPQVSAVKLPGRDVKNAVHDAHALAPAVLEYVPAGHGTHALALLAPVAPEYAPAGHDTQTLALLAPVAPEYVPAEQFVHDVVPNCPAGHCTGGHVYVFS